MYVYIYIYVRGAEGHFPRQVRELVVALLRTSGISSIIYTIILYCNIV